MKFKRYKFMAAAFLLFSVPYSLISMHLLNSISDISKKDMISYMEFRTKNLASDVSDILNYEYDALKICDDRSFLSAGLDGKKSSLSKLASSNKNIIKELTLVSAEGNELFSTLKNKKPEKWAGNPVFRNAVTDEFSVGAVNYPYDEPPELLIGSPVLKAKGEKPRYILLARLSLGYLNEKIAEFSKRNYGKTALIDSGAQIIFDSGYDYLFKAGLKSDFAAPIIASLAQKNISSYGGEIKVNGVERLISVANVDSTAWWVYETVDVENVIDYSLYKWAKKVIYTGYVVMVFLSLVLYKITEFLFRIKEN